MAKPNYSFEKRQRELAKKKKKEEKLAKKQPNRSDASVQDDAAVTPTDETAPAGDGATSDAQPG